MGALITGAIAAVGLGMQIFGASQGQDAARQQAAIAQQQAQVQQQINAQQRAALQLQQQAADIQYNQTLGQLEASKEVVGKQQEIESVKLQAAVLDTKRKTRDAIRDMIIARSNSLATAVSKGASTQDSSVVGARSQIESKGAENILGLNQNLYAGKSIFDINKSISDIYLGQQTASLGFLQQSHGLEAGVRSIQQNVFSLNDMQAALAARSASVGGQAASAQAYSSIGGGLMNQAQSFGNVGTQASGYLRGLNLFS